MEYVTIERKLELLIYRRLEGFEWVIGQLEVSVVVLASLCVMRFIGLVVHGMFFLPCLAAYGDG